MSTDRKIVDVAVAVVQRSDGLVLWGSRPEGKPYAGYWEFPGGKVEAGETVWQALVREIHEELGVTATAGGPWLVIEHDYPHAKVRLHFMRVWGFEGEPVPQEGQQVRWATLHPADPAIDPILPATLPLLTSLSLPEHMWLTQFQRFGVETGAIRLREALMHCGIRPIIQFREKKLSDTEQVAALRALLPVVTEFGLTLLVNSDCNSAIHAMSAQRERNSQVQWGIHWTEHHLLGPDFEALRKAYEGRIQLASVHSAQSLSMAASFGLHGAVLGTVLPTASHPDGVTLGWGGFSDIACHTRIPVYSIGGMSMDSLQTAWQYGAHGIAVQRGWS